MGYKILIEKRAVHELGKLEKSVTVKIMQKIEELADNPRPIGCKKLTDQEDWRIRIGDYRVVYRIQAELLTCLIIRVGHRKNVCD